MNHEEMQGCIFNIQRFSIHDGPGIRTAVFLKGCPLRCPWCSNPESQSREPEPIWDNIKKKTAMTGEYYTIDEVMDIIRKDADYYAESGGGVTVTGGEVLAQKDFALELLEACRNEGIHTACETTAFAQPEHFVQLLEHTDLLIMDLKHYDPAMHKAKTGVPLAPILANLDQAVKVGKDMLLRIPVIPFFNHSLADAEHFGALLEKHNVKKAELLPFHQFGKSKYKFLDRAYEYEHADQLTRDDLLEYGKIIEKHGVDCVIA